MCTYLKKDAISAIKEKGTELGNMIDLTIGVYALTMPFVKLHTFRPLIPILLDEREKKYFRVENNILSKRKALPALKNESKPLSLQSRNKSNHSTALRKIYSSRFQEQTASNICQE